MKYSSIFITSVLLFVCFINIYSQDYPPSVGPAPYVYNKAPENQLFTDAIGTRAFTQIYSSPTTQFGKLFLEGCSPTNLGPPFSIQFPGGLVAKNGVVYTWNQSTPYQLWSIDTVTGIHTLVFNLTGNANFTGMCWDGNMMYGISTNILQTAVYRINMTNGTCSSFGYSMECAGGITLLGRMGSQYSLFVLDIVNDNLYKINKTTGVFTLVGPLGQNINFGQDGSVDPLDNTFYAMCYTVGPELRKIDTVTGALGPVICTYTAQATGLAAISSVTPPPPGPQITVCRSPVNVPINDHSWTYDSVQVNIGSGGYILDVNVRIDSVLHSWDSDLSFYLSKPGRSVKIINRAGGSGDNFLLTVLNDSAVTPIASGTAPFTGSFLPSNPLTVFNGPFNGGYWKLSISDTATGDTGYLRKWCLILQYTIYDGGIQTIEIPNYYFLNQNYPNPFNPVTNIKFGIPESGDVRLVVYDILGREVTTLVNEFKVPGTYDVQFDASNMASGIYFYLLQTFRGIETKRMLMIK